MHQTYKLYIGLGVGLLITIIFPTQNIADFLQVAVNITVSIGRYLFIPVMFFGIIAGFARHIEQNRRVQSDSANNNDSTQHTHAHMHKEHTEKVQDKSKAQEDAYAHMREERKRTRKIYIYTFLALVIVTVLLVITGGVAIIFIPLPRLPIIFQEFMPINLLSVEEIFSLVFPRNLFNVFSQDGNFILPIAIIGLIFGAAMKFQASEHSSIHKISIEILDVFNFLLNVYVHLLGLGIILISMHFVIRVRSIPDTDLFYQFIATIFALAAGVIFILYPLIAVLTKCKIKPIVLIRNILGPTVISAIPGDNYFASILVLRSFQKRFSANKDIPYNLTLIGTLFSKGGSAFISSIIFFMVLQSYTAIEVTFLNAVWIMTIIILLSPLASISPQFGILHILVAVTALYGGGLENGFLIIIPILPLLIAIATLLDTLTIVFFGYLLADTLGFSETGIGSDRRKRIWVVTKKIIS